MQSASDSEERKPSSEESRPDTPDAVNRVLTADPRTLLTTIYVALGFAVAALAIVFYAVGPVAQGGMDRSLFRWIWLGAAAVCTIGAGIVRGRAREVSAQPRSVLPAAVIVWSLAEAQALLAAIGYFLTGDLPLLVAGLVLFIFLLGRHRPSAFLDRG